uniref:AMP-binding protein n=1 Tax=Thaumasiovibrio occultus TaxID=1891184 RepID=UPI000B3501DB|nr:AMP-binding protein [Thaumasiovibrio occultus]
MVLGGHVANNQLAYQHLLQRVAEKPDAIYLKQIVNREFRTFTFAEVKQQALQLITFLREQGCQPGDRVALIAKNCAEWFIADFAMMMGGYVSVPIFPTAGSDTIEYCLTHSESKLLIVGKLDNADALNQTLQSVMIPTLGMPYDAAPACDFGWENVGSASPFAEAELPPVQGEDLMSIVYTSGTSGTPKGALLTHERYIWTVNALVETIDIQADDRMFSYLPLAHITERVYILGSSFVGGVCTAFPESLDTFIDDVKMQRPTLFISVPRLWTLFQQRILDKLPQAKLNILLKIPFVSGLIKRKLADGLGLDQARVLGCGSAPVSPALLKWYESVGLNITEAWGMTESFAYGTLNYPFRSDKVGSVGRAGVGVEIKIADDEEILVRSGGIFSGYYKDPDTFAETVVDDWLHTGDLGKVDSDGYLTIIGRKKDTFKTAKGKYVAPVPIEKRIFEISNIEMMCLIGSGMPAPVLLAVPHAFPNFDQARYERTIERVIDTINQSLESHEKLAGALMIDQPWSIENGILTPTLKIKRHILEQQYHEIGVSWPKGTKVQWEKDLA